MHLLAPGCRLLAAGLAPGCAPGRLGSTAGCLLLGGTIDVTLISGGGGSTENPGMFLHTGGHAHIKIHSMKILSCYLGNTAASLSGRMKILGCYMGNRLAAANNSYVCR